MNLIIDVGNTIVKIAIFNNDSIVKKKLINKNDLFLNIRDIILNFPIKNGIISSVSIIDKSIISVLKKNISLIELSYKTKIPFINLYKSPKTLGVDRIAIASAAVKKFPNKNVLIIDSGTCLTFDFINQNSQYIGGSISLGLKMRYLALNKFTSKLPLLDFIEINDFIGNDTQNSIHCGVFNGIVNEINSLISLYKEKYKELTIVLTGGDAKFLLKQLKNGIFANPNFVLEGLHEILKYNLTNG